MAFQLANDLCCIKYYWGGYEQNSIVNRVRVDLDDWTLERVIIASSEFSPFHTLFA